MTFFLDWLEKLINDQFFVLFVIFLLKKKSLPSPRNLIFFVNLTSNTVFTVSCKTFHFIPIRYITRSARGQTNRGRRAGNVKRPRIDHATRNYSGTGFKYTKSSSFDHHHRGAHMYCIYTANFVRLHSDKTGGGLRYSSKVFSCPIHTCT